MATRPNRWVPAAAVGAALALGSLSIRGRGRGLDQRLFRFMNSDRGPVADAVLESLTELGSIWASVGAAAVLAVRGWHREGLDALGAAGAMWLAGQGAKEWVGRPRPYEALPDVRLLIDRPRGSSWPSSHPAVLLAFVTVAARDLGLRPCARAALAGLVGAVAASRVYLGVHYPADVIGGLLLGKGVADMWSATVSPLFLGRGRVIAAPGTVGR